jgi:hypothetical protein
MKNINVRFLYPFFITLLFFILLCSNPANNDTPQEKTGRIITGKFVDWQNKPVSGAIVRLYPVGFVPSLSLSKTKVITIDSTDENGNYQIPISIDSGDFNIEGQKDTIGVFIDSVNVPQDSDDVIVSEKTLKKLGIIKGISHMPGQNDTNQVRVTLYIPGTGRITKPVIGGKFTFSDVPEGKYQLIIDPTLNQYNVRVIDTTILAGDILDLDTILLSIYSPDTVEVTNTTVSGTWGPGKVYRVLNTIEIPNGASLNILPGTQVQFMGNYFFNVSGTLRSLGKEDSLIVYQYGYSSGFWQGIQLWPAESLSISYSIVENAATGLGIGTNKFPVSVANCVFRYCDNGINLYAHSGPSNVYIINSILHDIKDVAVYLTPGDSNITCYFVNDIFVKNGAGILRNYCPPNNVTSILNSDCVYANSKDNFQYIRCNVEVLPDTQSTINLVTSDPSFINLSKGSEDYHLGSLSPCKTSGMNGTDMGIYSTYKP